MNARVTALTCVINALGDASDNLYRTEHTFKDYTDEQLDKPYGKSSDTCREILCGYRRHVENLQKAREWVREQQ